MNQQTDDKEADGIAGTVSQSELIAALGAEKLPLFAVFLARALEVKNPEVEIVQISPNLLIFKADGKELEIPAAMVELFFYNISPVDRPLTFTR